MSTKKKSYASPTNIILDLYPDISGEDYLDVQAETIVFLAMETGQTSLDQTLTTEQASQLSKHLSQFLEKKQKEVFGRTTLGKTTIRSVTSLRGETNHNMSDGELMSVISGLAENTAGQRIDLKADALGQIARESEVSREAILMVLEQRREQLDKILSIVELEAIEIKTQDELDQRPRFTLGFDPIGLQMLFRRARIRMLWSELKKGEV
jgi:hypothetical protein